MGPKNAPLKSPRTVPLPVNSPVKPGFALPIEPIPATLSSAIGAPPVTGVPISTSAVEIAPVAKFALNVAVEFVSRNGTGEPAVYADPPTAEAYVAVPDLGRSRASVLTPNTNAWP